MVDSSVLALDVQFYQYRKMHPKTNISYEWKLVISEQEDP